MAELTVENLHLKYGDNPILKGVALTLNRGEVVSLLGPSGSGKTTLLRAVAGLEVPHEGSIKIALAREVVDGENGNGQAGQDRHDGHGHQQLALASRNTTFNGTDGLFLVIAQGQVIGRFSCQPDSGRSDILLQKL